MRSYPIFGCTLYYIRGKKPIDIPRKEHNDRTFIAFQSLTYFHYFGELQFRMRKLGLLEKGFLKDSNELSLARKTLLLLATMGIKKNM